MSSVSNMSSVSLFALFALKLLTILSFAVSLSGCYHSSDLREAVKTILRSSRHNETSASEQKDVWQQHADDLRPLMADPFPVLSELLTDYDYGYRAAETMLRIDRARALPLILKAASSASRDVQNIGFNEFVSVYFASPVAPIYAPEAHAAAIAVLENQDSPADTLESALYVMGLTGNERDFPLLEHAYAQNNGESFWSAKLHAASEAALARLGSPGHIERIRDDIKRTVPAHLDLKAGQAIENSLHEAAFVGTKEFVPLVCSHLGDPAASDGEDSFVLPAQTAGAALSAIVDRTSPFDVIGRGQEWKSSCPSK
jgi:hypothetical protein